MSNNYVEACLAGEALLYEIDDYIETWHTSDSLLPLHEFLGMTEQEYEAWVEDETALSTILFFRKNDTRFVRRNPTSKSNDYKLAARTNSPEEARKIHNWLKKRLEK